MQNLAFLKPMLAEAEERTALVELNKDQLKDAMKTIVTHYEKNRRKKGIIISLSAPIEQITEEDDFSMLDKEQLILIDMCSGKKGKATVNGFKTFFIETPSDLTSLRIILENLLQKNENEKNEKKFVLFDSISALSTYVERKVLDKFMYYLNNKISFEGDTGIFLSIKNPKVDEDIEIIKQFCSKFYDFSGVVTMEVEKAE
ncbi:MAG: hypothetical protein WC308_01190 [archaeon]|jgi:hypothetical protein